MSAPEAGNPLVSVIIPTYNYARYIEGALRSAVTQTYPALEIIIIDDGSTDDTADRVASFTAAEADKPGRTIEYVQQENRGLPAARNAGLERATGKYVQFLDSDDLLHPNAVAQRVALLEAQPGAVYCCCANRMFYEQGGRLRALQKRVFRGWRLPDQEDMAASLAYANLAPPHAFLVRGSAITEASLRFDTGLKACEDYDFWLQLMRHYRQAPLISPGLVYYRKHSASMSANSDNQLRHDCLMIPRVMDTIIQGGFPPETSREDMTLALMASTLRMIARLDPETHAAELEEMRNSFDAMAALLDQSDGHATAPVEQRFAEVRVLVAMMNRSSREQESERVTALLGRLPGGYFQSLRYLAAHLLKGKAFRQFWNIFFHDLEYLAYRVTGGFRT